MNTMKNPMPTPMEVFRGRGMALKIFSRTGINVQIKNTMPSTNTAIIPNCHEIPMLNTTENAKNGTMPTPGASANGYFPKSPIRIVPMNDARAAAMTAPPAGIPISPITLG